MVSQVLQSLASSKLPTEVPGKREAIRKKSMKFEDDRCLNKTFQLFKVYKHMLDNGGENLQKISEMFFPPQFDFEQALYMKNHQKIINLLIKSSINSLICLKDEITKGKNLVKPLAPDQIKTPIKGGAFIGESTLLIRREVQEEHYSLRSRDSESGKGGSDPGERRKPMMGATGERNLMQHTLSDALSLSQNKLGLIEDPMFSDSFLNQTDIKNNLLRPFQIGRDPATKADKSTQVNAAELRSAEESNDSYHFSVI